ncbi:hypothetical protein [Paramicrobacterium agarici]|nr:hypothetical protein [Microbacterium agarici]
MSAHNAGDRPRKRNTADPTKMANQPALRTSSGAIWLIVGAVLTVICLLVIVPLIQFGNPVTLVGAVLVVVLYIAMIVVRLTIAARVTRLRVLAVLFGLIALIGLLTVLIDAFAGWR